MRSRRPVATKPAAFIVEPLILGAGGMLMYPARVLKEMKRICEASGVLFIADEVMTGWGRTGTLFACEQADVSPDIACYSKGLTGGIASACRDAVPGRDFRGALLERPQPHVLSFELAIPPIRSPAPRPRPTWICGTTRPSRTRVARSRRCRKTALAALRDRRAIQECPPHRHDHGARAGGARRRLSLRHRPEASRLLRQQRPAAASARQYHLRDAALLRHASRSRRDLRGDRRSR